ncbi:hypothetical protein SAMN05216526_1542 [Ectothiorhodosinus mongolicus]|uniref:DUF4351 domain-containing protein n=1 Tax=Ectothiorhodosinus mongolicus TaxID=233100 RepID=A0A1R3W330_9GAMM|nr:hypothetical protein [Ectothiorhodosinus mongolicus]SIT71373.1 hypothetical protein SAMN05216526_1542 [Ectothiorhodosinus mongolicus]
MMRLPEPDEERIYQQIEKIRESKHMPYVTTAERIQHKRGLQQGLEKGHEQGLEKGLQTGHRQGEVDMLMRLVELKFGSEAVKRYAPLAADANEDQLRQWAEGILTADSAAALFS